MGFFGSTNISKKRLEKILYRMKLKNGLSEHDIQEVKEVFRGDLDEHGSSKGISKDEMKNGISWLKDHRERHHLSSDDIDELENLMRDHL